MESWLTEALESAGPTLETGGDHLTLLSDPTQIQLDLSVPLQLLYDEITAYKCRLCASLYLSISEVSDHIERQHCQSENNPTADLILREEPVLSEEPLLRLGVLSEAHSMLELPQDSILREVEEFGASSEEQPVDVESFDVQPLEKVVPEVQEQNFLAKEAPVVAESPAKEVASMEKPEKKYPSTEEILEMPVNDDDKRMYICGECGHVSSTLKDCKVHMKKVHLNGEYNDSKAADGSKQAKKGDSARDSAKTVKQQKKKPKQHNPQRWAKDRRVICREVGCSIRFTCEEKRNIHERCHAESKIFKCFVCREEPSDCNWVRLKTHLWRLHGIDADLFSCNQCDFKSAVCSNLENHKLTHTDERKFTCAKCGKGFKQLPQLLNHRVIHKEADMPVPKWCEPQMCNFCSKMFASPKSLRIHQRIRHDKIREFRCAVCNHTSATKALLVLHMRGHSGEMPFVCPDEFCDFRTRDPSCFRKHKMRHAGVRPYKCPHCKYECIQSSAFKKHVIMKHDGVGIFQCGLCSYRTVNNISFRTHVDQHAKGLITTPSSDDEDPDDALTALVSRSDPIPEVSAISGVLSGDVGDDCLERHEYVFTIAPDASAVDRGDISIPAGDDECHLVNRLIGGAVVEEPEIIIGL